MCYSLIWLTYSHFNRNFFLEKYNTKLKAESGHLEFELRFILVL